MRHYLDGITKKFDIAIEGTVETASLRGGEISGKWATKPKIWTPRSWPRSIAEEVLNLTESVSVQEIPGKVLEFTQKFGVFGEQFSPGVPFRFKVSDWLSMRAELEAGWGHLISSMGSGKSVKLWSLGGGYFELVERRLRFRTRSLFTYASLEIAAVPPARLRICENRLNGCKTPYIIATDLRSRYCSKECSSAAAREAKLRWWNENRKKG